jgi:hypothetical protein
MQKLSSHLRKVLPFRERKIYGSFKMEGGWKEFRLKLILK